MTLSPIDRLLAISECTDLMHEYAYRFDHGAGVTVADLFVEDGEWISPAVVCRGRAELRTFFKLRDEMANRVTRHVVTNIDIDVRSPERAEARSIAVEFRGGRGEDGLAIETRPAVIGDYEDDFVRVEGIWRFRRRRVALEFKRPGEEFLRVTSG